MWGGTSSRSEFATSAPQLEHSDHGVEDPRERGDERSAATSSPPAVVRCAQRATMHLVLRVVTHGVRRSTVTRCPDVGTKLSRRRDTRAALKPRAATRAQARRTRGAPSGGRREFLRPAPSDFRFSNSMHRARAEPGGGRRPLEAPQGPRAARREALERRGGMGFPPLGFPWMGGASERGFPKGENQGGGREARPVPLPAGRLESLSGWAGAKRRSSREH